jgi:CubicO group peptidase (beta-lactamase class C family)
MNPPGMVTLTLSKGLLADDVEGSRVKIEGENLPMTLETNFDVASLTKIIFTTNVFMLLVDKEMVELEDTVSRFLPDWKTSEKGGITISDLLSHRSGLEQWRPFYITCKDETEVLRKISKTPLKFPVNESRNYSDLGFITLGAIAKVIIGKNYDQILNNEIKTQISMPNTSFTKPVNISNVAASSNGDTYEFDMVSTGIPYPVQEKPDEFSGWRDRHLIGEINDGNSFHVFEGASGHAGIFSNASDILELCKIYLNSYIGEGVFKSSTLRKFLQPGLDQMQGLGFRNWRIKTETGSKTIYGHTGFTGTAFGFIPEDNFAAVMLTNRLHASGAAVKTEDLWMPFLESSLTRR